MTTKKKNDSPNLLKRNALIISIAFNILLTAMVLVLYVPTLLPPPPTPDAFQLTTTELIRTATEGLMTDIASTPLILTPIFEVMPTLSPEDETVLRERYLNELRTELGFLHPVLEEKVGWYISSIRHEIEYHNETGYGATNIPDKFIQDMDRTTFENVEYVAVIIPFHRGVGATQGFFFRVIGGSAELLAQTDLAVNLEGFEDRNGNSFLDVAFQWSSCGSHCSYGMDVYEIRSNGEFVNLTENLNASIIGFVDLEGDDVLELLGTHELFVPEGATWSSFNDRYYDGIPRWFFWNGEAYEPFPTFVGE